MNFNTKAAYFGTPTYKTDKDDFYKTAPEIFIKEDENLYTRLKSKNKSKVREFHKEAEEYVTVSELYSVVDMMDKKNIPDTISEKMLNLYLLKYKLFVYKKPKYVEGYGQKTK